MSCRHAALCATHKDKAMDILTRIAEQRIQEAIEQGQFENLPGSGRPLVLENDSHIPEHLRLAFKVLKNAGILPPELEDRKQINSILELLEACDDEKTAYLHMQKLKLLMSKMAMRRGRPLHIADAYYSRVIERISVKGRTLS
jgi:hypothetical protein